MPRIWKVRFALLIIALVVLALAAGATIARSQRDDDGAGREAWRIQRKVETLEDQHTALRIELEKRLTRLESRAEATTEAVNELKRLIWGAIATLGLQVLETLGGMIWARRITQRKERTS